jgi:hypothetical protein
MNERYEHLSDIFFYFYDAPGWETKRVERIFRKIIFFILFDDVVEFLKTKFGCKKGKNGILNEKYRNYHKLSFK